MVVDVSVVSVVSDVPWADSVAILAGANDAAVCMLSWWPWCIVGDSAEGSCWCGVGGTASLGALLTGCPLSSF